MEAWEYHCGAVPIADVALTNDGVVVCAGSGSVEVWAFTVDGRPIRRESLGAGWHPRTEGRTILYHDGTWFRAWSLSMGHLAPIPGKPVGNNATALSPSGLRFFQRNTDASFPIGVYRDELRIADYRPTGIWEARDDGTVTLMDDCNRPRYAPGAGGYVHRCGDLMVGEGPQGGTQVWLDGQRHILHAGTDTKWPRVSVWHDLVAIVSWGDKGTRLWVGSRADVIALPLEVVAPPVEPPAPPPVVVAVPPAPVHLKGCGYFFRDTNIHAYIKKYGAENPAAPGTHSVIVDDHGLPAEPRADGSCPRMIVGLGQLLHPQMPEWWGKVDAVYVAVENDEPGLHTLMGLARYLMQRRSLTPKPLLTYTGGPIFPAVHRPEDILGVQFYAPKGAGPEYFRQLAAEVWPKVQSVPRVAIIGQAYDRAGWFDGPTLAAMQPVLYEIACAWPNCEYLLWFSDARTGGTRDHEEMRPYHQAIYEAIRRNS